MIQLMEIPDKKSDSLLVDQQSWDENTILYEFAD